MEVLEAKTDVGLVREHNEDSILCVRHPRNKNIKLLVVADGMGGKKYGDVASKYVTHSLNRWFNNKNIKALNDTEKIEKVLKDYINSLNANLIRKYGKNILGTTLTLALINKNKTLVLNIGDSRAYIYKNKKLIQVTEDDSDVWIYHKLKGIKKDYLRFFTNNNIITACVGLSEELCTITSKILDNDYDILLLFTDGVTDIITDRKIKKLIRRKPKKELLNSIINEAVNVEQHLHLPISLKRKLDKNFIIPFKGRDNASGAIYIKNA